VEEVGLDTVMAHVVVRVGDNLMESAITRRSTEEMHLAKGDTVEGHHKIYGGEDSEGLTAFSAGRSVTRANPSSGTLAGWRQTRAALDGAIARVSGRYPALRAVWFDCRMVSLLDPDLSYAKTAPNHQHPSLGARVTRRFPLKGAHLSDRRDIPLP